MASIISAGTSTGSALNMTGDTSGALALATNNGTTAVTINTSQNVGVGTTSPVRRLHVSSTEIVAGIIQSTNAANYSMLRFLDGANTVDASAAGIGSIGTSLALYANGGEKVRITSDGNVGIGSSNPGYNLDIYGASTAYSALRGDSNTQFVVSRASTDSTGGFVQFYKARGTQTSPTIVSQNDIAGRMVFYGYDGTQYSGTAEIRATIDGTPGTTDMPGRLMFYTVPDGSASLTERMRIDSGGRVQIGTTATSPASADTYGIVLGVDGVGGAYAGSSQFSTNGNAGIVLNRGGDNGTTLAFKRSGTTVGGVNVTTSATSYATSSDYRLKENIAPMTGALSTVSQLKPVTYTWKIDGSSGQGFIAHELQELVPDAVTGEKDAVDADGNPDYQGIDTSFLVATLTAAIQELKVIVDAQAVEIAALKTQVGA
jgi:hypothetical protein